jgi:hypothetical protein
MSVLRKVLGALALVAVAAVFGIGAIALAPRAEAAGSLAAELRGGRGFCGAAGLEAAAQALGLAAEEVQTQLRAGESLADLADAQGVELQTVLDAVTAACVQATRDQIAAAVTAGTMTQAQADWLNEGLDQGFWGPAATDGAGLGFGFGGRGGFGHAGRFGPGPNTPATTATPTVNS